MAAEPKFQIPVLTEAVDTLETDIAVEAALFSGAGTRAAAGAAGDRETLIAELQTQIAAGAFALTNEIMRAAFAEMEASVFEKISGRLRRELPEMIDRLLRERLHDESDY